MGIAMALSENEKLIENIKKEKLWEMEFSKDNATCTEDACDKVTAWVTAKGVSLDAKDFKNFQLAEGDENLADYEEQFEIMKMYKKEFDNKEADAEALDTLEKILAKLNETMAEDDKDGRILFEERALAQVRVLADDIEVAVVEDSDPNATGALKAGDDE